jgi:hypothetical protein
MSYSVVWRPKAEQELAALWLAAPDRKAITTSVHQIDQFLANEPADQGRWLIGVTRTLIVPPLAVVYEIIEDDRKVSVLTIWRED